MKLLLKIFGLGAAGSISLPVVLGAAAAALAALGGLLWYGNHLWEEHKTALRNEGAMACVNTVRDAEHAKLKSDYEALIKQMSAERERAAAFKRETDEIRAKSAQEHQAIAAAMKTQPSCKLPDAVIDSINRAPKVEPATKGAPLK